MKRYVFPFALLAALSIVGVAYLVRPAASTSGAASAASTASAPEAVAPVSNKASTASIDAPHTYTSAEVTKHAGAASCWTSINGKVYDVTSWINQHPGGQAAILSLCGTDGSGAFNAQHGGQRRPEAELATFLIGTLK